MSFLSRIWDWIRGRGWHRSTEANREQLREFVYLDEVSLLSMLASRLGGIPTDFTEDQTSSVNSEISSSISVPLGASVGVGSRVQSGQTYRSQVLSKAIVQTNFKLLYESEKDEVVLQPPVDAQPPTIKDFTDFDRALDRPRSSGWVVDASTIRRGDLMEVELEIEAEPLFHMATVITTLCELMEEGDQLFDRDIVTELGKMRAIARVLGGLLGGLVPIRGRVLDYELIADRGLLVHRSLLEQLPSTGLPKTIPIFVAGVIERDLFWKDSKRVLFSKARYKVFCRLLNDGLTETWRPVKGMDVLSGVIPGLDEQIQEFSESARIAIQTASERTVGKAPIQEPRDGQVIEQYVSLLSEYHDRDLTREVIGEILQTPRKEDWLNAVESRRQVLRAVTDRVDSELRVETSPEIASDFRVRALGLSELSTMGVSVDRTPSSSASSDANTDPAPVLPSERFFDAEITAIYW